MGRAHRAPRLRFLDRKVADLSTGNKRKLGLIQAFMHRPELLILDEPTAGLDPLVQHEFYHLVEEAREAGQTVFLSSHVLPEVQGRGWCATASPSGARASLLPEDVAELDGPRRAGRSRSLPSRIPAWRSRVVRRHRRRDRRQRASTARLTVAGRSTPPSRSYEYPVLTSPRLLDLEITRLYDLWQCCLVHVSY